MALDPSINNVGEYYSAHYLSSTFSKDIKSLIAEWRNQGSEAVPNRIRRLSQLYFRAKAQAMEEDRPEDRWQAGEDLAAWHPYLLEALGYTDRKAVDIPVEGAKTFVPAMVRINRYNRPWLVICETYFCLPDASLKEGRPSEDPLEMEPVQSQLSEPEHPLCAGTWERLIGRVFTEEDAPRWVMLLAGSQLLLLDKHTFAQGRYLSFDFDDAFGRNEKSTYDHFAAFLSAQTLCPEGESDEVLHDKLEEQSHRFAHGVTENLQLAVRVAIEDLANEWVEDRRRRNLSFTRRYENELLSDGTDEITAEHLRHEALVFVYRLLFCFYAEARGGELDILPITDDVYRLGYSLESLRDLEQVPLTAQTEVGTYFHKHLKILFSMIHQGFNPKPVNKDKSQQEFAFTYQSKTFSIRPLTATLFAPASTPLLNNARLTNQCLQDVIRNLSLSYDEKNKSIGRVNYAELGINQLGAVYEGLLSYKGMFAREDLIQVKPPKGSFKDKKTPTWFVPATRLDEFRNEKQKNIVERIDGKPKIYKKGRFILHLSGIEREQSASYYTPEVLTQCLVEEALRELLKGYGPEDADKILELKICEPAMGSGAFLNEAANQLARHYLDLKQKQVSQTIEPGRYLDELRRVKHYITTRNAYGVDLNPTAVELGGLSMWLNSIHRLLIKQGENGEPDQFQSGATPWFGLRLRCGNSLIGARRAVWTEEQLRKKKHFGKNSEIPRLLKPGEARQGNEIYHFLVFDEDMVPTHSDQLMRQFWPERCGAAKRWINKQVKTAWEQEEIVEAKGICDLIDSHWEKYSKQRADALEKTACTATVWPESSDSEAALENGPSLEEQEQIKANLESNSGSFQRLKLIMDTWCALWFWPLDKVEELPSRQAFLAAASLLLGDKAPDQSVRAWISANLGFDIDGVLKALGQEVPDAQEIADAVAWFGSGQAIAGDQHFHHWELVFPELLGLATKDGGFDLILGNPPWVLGDWQEAPVLNEIEPLLGVRNSNSAVYAKEKLKIQDSEDKKNFYCINFTRAFGAASFLSSKWLYDIIGSMRTNLYKNFIIIGWSLIRNYGILSFLHPNGIYEDYRGGKFRAEAYKRLLSLYQLKNELKLFKDVHDQMTFSINIYDGKTHKINFIFIANLFHPKTITDSHNNLNSDAPIPAIKDENGKWEFRGHKKRIIQVTEEILRFIR